MKLSISNIAWNDEEDGPVLELLSLLAVDGIEVAPTRLWPKWEGASVPAARRVRAQLERRGFCVPALQSILFARPELNVFGPTDVQRALLEHIERVAELAEAFGAKVLVFGSPRNRDPGELHPDAAFTHGQAFFYAAGERCAPFGVSLCLEPNPPQYACRFLTSWRDVVAMVQRVAHPNVRVHLDCACIALAGDDPVEAIESCGGTGIAHFHVSSPNLADLQNTQIPHAAIGSALHKARYENWVSIEMRRSESPLRSVEHAVREVRKYYDGG